MKALQFDSVLKFILTGVLYHLPLGSVTSRFEVIKFFENVQGFNKKNGVYEVIRKDNTYFYFGFGHRGILMGVKINSLLPLKINQHIIDESLAKNNILYQTGEQELRYILENGVQIYFTQLEGQNYVNEIVKAESGVIAEKLLSLN